MNRRTITTEAVDEVIKMSIIGGEDGGSTRRRFELATRRRSRGRRVEQSVEYPMYATNGYVVTDAKGRGGRDGATGDGRTNH